MSGVYRVTLISKKTTKGETLNWMIDYKLKSELLKQGLPKLVNQISLAEFAQAELENFGTIIHSKIDYDTAQEMRCFLIENYGDVVYNECLRINSARYKRTKRLRCRISEILRSSKTVVFVTLTFNDKTLQTTSADTRRQKVRRYLSKFSNNYVANKDFGSKNNREHYHAIIDCNVDRSLWEKNGFILTEYVQAPDGVKTLKKIPRQYELLPDDQKRQILSILDEKRLSKYIAKLTNHSIKETAKGSRIIYGR